MILFLEMIHWDPTINLGTVVVIGTLIVPLIKLIRHLDRIEFKLDTVWDWYKKSKDDCPVEACPVRRKFED